MARKIGLLDWVLCASPEYILRHVASRERRPISSSIPASRI